MADQVYRSHSGALCCWNRVTVKSQLTAIRKEILHVTAERGVIEDKYGRVLTITSSPVMKYGHINTMSFDGSSSTIAGPSVDILVPPFTIIFWVYNKNINDEHLIHNNTFGGTGNVVVQSVYYGAKNRFALSYNNFSTTVRTNPSNYDNNRWTMFAGTWNSSNYANLYVDGEYSNGGSLGAPTTLANFTIMRSGKVLNGLMSNIRIFNGLLTASEIAQLYSSERKKYGV